MDTYKMTLRMEVLNEFAWELFATFFRYEQDGIEFDKNDHIRVSCLHDKILHAETMEELAEIENVFMEIRDKLKNLKTK